MPATITGTLTNVSGNALADTVIAFKPKSTPIIPAEDLGQVITSPVQEVTSDASGTFSIDLEKGDYLVSVGDYDKFNIAVDETTGTHSIGDLVSTSLVYTGGVVPGALPVLSVAGKTGIVTLVPADVPGCGDVVGPASSVDSTIPLFDGTTGKLLKDSGLTTAQLAATISLGSVADVTLTSVATSDLLQWNGSAWVNQTVSAVVGSAYVAKAGDTMTGALLLADGTAGAPSLSFSSDIDTGMFLSGGAGIGVSVGGTQRGRWLTSGLYVDSGSLYVGSGSAAAPAVRMSSDTDTGIWFSSDSYIGLSVAGTGVAQFYKDGQAVFGDGTGLTALGTATIYSHSASSSTLIVRGANGQVLPVFEAQRTTSGTPVLTAYGSGYVGVNTTSAGSTGDELFYVRNGNMRLTDGYKLRWENSAETYITGRGNSVDSNITFNLGDGAGQLTMLHNGELVVNGNSAQGLGTLTVYGHSATVEAVTVQSKTGTAAGQVVFSINDVDTGTDQLVVTNGDGVAIGKSSPGAILDITGEGSGGRGLRVVDTTASKSSAVYTMEIDSSAHTSNLAAAGAMIVTVNSGTALVVTGQGNVGIATTSPDHLLHINTSTVAEGARVGSAFIGNWNSISTYAVFCNRTMYNVTASYAMLQDASGATFINAASGQDIRFAIAGTGQHIMKSDGLVGIGATSPSSALDIDVSGRASTAHALFVRDTDQGAVTTDWRPFNGSTTATFRVQSTATNAFLMVPTTTGQTEMVVAGGSLDIYSDVTFPNGISSATPGLSVNGSKVVVNGTSDLGTLTIYSSSTSDESLVIQTKAGTAGTQPVFRIMDSTVTSLWTVYGDGDAALGADFTPATGSIQTREKDFIVDYTSATARRYIGLRRDNSAVAYFGVANSTDDLITGAATGDVVLRIQNASLLFSTDGGTTTFAKIDSSGVLTTSSGRINNTTTVNAATYDLLVTDYILHVTYTSTGAVTSLTLPTAQAVAGRVIIIKDAGNNASVNNITVDTGGGELIEFASTLVIDGDGDSISLYSDGTDWFVF